jgi:hypothetical protein
MAFDDENRPWALSCNYSKPKGFSSSLKLDFSFQRVNYAESRTTAMSRCYHLTSHGGRDFQAALLALNRLGYVVDAMIIRHDSRTNRTLPAALPGIPIQSAPQGSARQARHRPAEISDRGFRPRLLLAQTCRMPAYLHAPVAQSILGQKIRAQHSQGRGESTGPDKPGLAGRGRLGVRTSGQGAPVATASCSLVA